MLMPMTMLPTLHVDDVTDRRSELIADARSFAILPSGAHPMTLLATPFADA
jgi:hypothetical protein